MYSVDKNTWTNLSSNYEKTNKHRRFSFFELKNLMYLILSDIFIIIMCQLLVSQFKKQKRRTFDKSHPKNESFVCKVLMKHYFEHHLLTSTKECEMDSTTHNVF